MKLKPYSKYDCHACNKHSKWTGAYDNPKDTDDVCLCCGAKLIENIEENTIYRVSWEMINVIEYPYLSEDTSNSPNDRYWKSIFKDYRNEYDAKKHRDGLLQLISNGEFIRNVRLEASALTEWKPL